MATTAECQFNQPRLWNSKDETSFFRLKTDYLVRPLRRASGIAEPLGDLFPCLITREQQPRNVQLTGQLQLLLVARTYSNKIDLKFKLHSFHLSPYLLLSPTLISYLLISI